MKINLKIEGDHEDNRFLMFLVMLERAGNSVAIALTAQQTNLAVEYNEDFKPILELKKILLESGFSIYQTINIINGDESSNQLDFEVSFNKSTEKTLSNKITKIDISYTNPSNPDEGNIIIRSARGHEFTIYTEADEMLPTETAKKLEVILNQ